MIGLIDTDTPVFAAAISSEDLAEYIAFSRLELSIERIKEASGCDEFVLYVSGKENFRKEIDPFYKANRPKQPPSLRQACHEYAIEYMGAIETDGYEADDALGCAQTKDTMIIGIDKDLLMIPGRHYQWPLVRGGKVIKEGKFHNISPIEGLRHFFVQTLTGDKSDNILQWFDENTQTWKKNKWALSDKAASKLLATARDEEGMYNIVYGHYKEQGKLDELENVMDLLWIWRSLGETYSQRRLIYGCV